MRFREWVGGVCVLAGVTAGSGVAQTAALDPLPIPMAPVTGAPSALRIVRDAVPTRPLSVTGPRGALLGEQSGVMEGWIFPWKIFSGLRMSVRMDGYPVPIDVNEAAASVDVQPDHTTITYAHANFTIRQVMFAPADGSGVAAYFEVESVRPLVLTVDFTAEMKRMWPAPVGGTGAPDWVATKGGSGFYVMRGDLPGAAGAIAMPGAEPGIEAPYQERPKTYPTQFVLRVDPKRDAGKVYPLLVTVGETRETASNAALYGKLLAEDGGLTASFAANQARYAAFLKEHTAVESPDATLNAAFQWAEVAIDQLRVQTTAASGVPDGGETALVAGFLASGDSARPGFGWFFGRDALWTLYAVNSYGDFRLSRAEMEFLLRRQRADGKIMHEWSQTAELVDWKDLPYEWAAADATPMLLMEMEDYRAISGDEAFVQAHWAELEKAWAFMEAHDSDGDGIYDNSQGTAWVESWVNEPHQELYLAAIDVQASIAFAKLARATGHGELAARADAKAAELKGTIEREYYEPATGSYAFSRNANGSLDTAATIFPTVAWWDGTYALGQPGTMLARWSSSEFDTDWGTRDLSPATSFYDPISYHMGTVWPLYTGWASVAQYRAGRPLAGYAALMQNADLTWASDLGDVTELLSGEFFRPLGRSTAHQLWSSAMVISPVMRGMFGLGWDASKAVLTVTPHLPASWDHAIIRRVPVGAGTTDLTFERAGGEMVVRASSAEVRLKSSVAGARASGAEVRVPLPAVEVGMRSELPAPGSVTTQMKVLDQVEGERSVTLRLSGMGGSREEMQVRRNKAGLRLVVDGATVAGGGALEVMTVEFPAGAGYVERTVKLTW